MTIEPQKPNIRGKRILTGALAVILFVVGLPNMLKGCQTTPSNPVGYETFDTNKADEVDKAAQNIHEDSEKQFSQEQIRDLLYFLNGKTEKIDFSGMTAEEGFKYLQDLMGIPLALLDDNTTDDHEKAYGNLELVEEDEEIFSADLTATNNKTDRNEAIEFSDITNEQLKDIDENKSEDYAQNATDFYNKLMEVKNNNKISDGIKIAILLDAKSKMHLYPSLTDEMKAEIDETLMLLLNNYGFSELEKLADIYNWDLTPLVNAGNTADPVTPEGKTYGDAEDAEQYRPKGDESSVVVDEGGKHVETVTEVKQESKPIKEETVTEVQKVPSTEPQTEVIQQGGTVISTEIYTEVFEVEPEEEIVTEIVEEGGVEQGTDIVEYTYVDDALVETNVLVK